MPGIARRWPANTRSGWCRCASARSRSACSPPPDASSSRARSTRSARCVAIAIERASLLDERKAAEIARRGEDLKTALLASLAHDLRTPLTAIRVAASNLQIAAARRRSAARAERADPRRSRAAQSRCSRTSSRWRASTPARSRPICAGRIRREIVAEARAQVERTLRAITCCESTVEPDTPVRLDPRLTATALAHVLENAAQYAPAGSAIDVARACRQRRPDDHACAITVRASRRPICRRLFERFYRGDADAARARRAPAWACRSRAVCWPPSTAASGRRIAPDGGAEFTIVVPAREPKVPGMTLRRRASCSSTTRSPSSDALGPLLRTHGYDVEMASAGSAALKLRRRARARSDRARSRPARSRRHRSLPAHSRDVEGADHRPVGARRRGRQGPRARSGRGRLRHQAVRTGGAAGAHPRRAAARACRTHARNRAVCGPAT